MIPNHANVELGSCWDNCYLAISLLGSGISEHHCVYLFCLDIFATIGGASLPPIVAGPHGPGPHGPLGPYGPEPYGPLGPYGPGPDGHRSQSKVRFYGNPAELFGHP